MKRNLLLALGAVVGLLLAGAYFLVQQQAGGVPEPGTNASDAFVFRLTVIFIAGIYNTGVIGFGALGLADEAQVLRHHQKRHMLVLNALVVLLFVLSLLYG